MMRFEKKSKLAPRYIDLYEIMEWVSKVANRLTLLVSIDHIHDMFHVLMLCKYIGDPYHVLRIEEIQL